jgi:hypothetical protein
VVRFVDRFRSGRHDVLVMERLQSIRWRGVHTEEAALALSVGILEAVAELHSIGICHLDLKPDNIMIKAGVVQLIDLGTARHCGDALEGSVGTPSFMAPEVAAMEAGTVHPCMDAFGAGRVLRHLCTQGKVADLLACVSEKLCSTDAQVRWTCAQAKEYLLTQASCVGMAARAMQGTQAEPTTMDTLIGRTKEPKNGGPCCDVKKLVPATPARGTEQKGTARQTDTRRVLRDLSNMDRGLRVGRKQEMQPVTAHALGRKQREGGKENAPMIS